jgi:iron-sulfur cluster assembly protein
MSETHAKDTAAKDAASATAAEPKGPKTEPTIVVAPRAAAKVKEQIAARAQSTPVSGIRVGVKGGGCSGLSYVIEFCDAPRAKDRLFEVDGARVYVDPKSLIYLNGTTLDFVETFQQKGFKFVNPQQRSECGCGESFSI